MKVLQVHGIDVPRNGGAIVVHSLHYGLRKAGIDFLIGGFSPPEGRLARGFKPPAFSRFLFQSAVKSAESF